MFGVNSIQDLVELLDVINEKRTSAGKLERSLSAEILQKGEAN